MGIDSCPCWGEGGMEHLYTIFFYGLKDKNIYEENMDCIGSIGSKLHR